MLGALAGGISEPDGSSEPGKFAQAAQIVSYNSSMQFAEFGEFLNQKLFTPRPESILSGVEGRLGGAISERR